MFILIKNAYIYAPQDLGINDVLIANNKIIDIKPNINFNYPCQIIDATNKILVPGFIDQHVHIIGGGGEDGFSSLIREIQVKDCITYGVTSVIGLLGTDCHAKSIAQLVAKTKALNEQGISAWCLTGSYALPSTTLTGDVGKDIAFIQEIIGCKVAICDHRSSQPTKQELTRLASICRTAGLLAKKAGIVHMHSGKGKDGYKTIMKIVQESDIPITQFRPTHVANQYNDAIQFAKLGGYIDFTANQKDAPLIAQTLKQIPLNQITMSSDSNGSFPIWSDDLKIIGMGVGKMETLFATIKDMILQQNVNISDAISLISQNVANALMLNNKGSIAIGKDGDIVLLDKQLNICDVIANGNIMLLDKKFIGKQYYNYD